MQALGQSPAWWRWQAEMKARRDWENEHPALAADWRAAIEEDDQRVKAREAAEEARFSWHKAGDFLRRLQVDCDTLAALEGVRDGPALEAARKFIDAPAMQARFLVLLGPKGTGKTVAAAWALRTLLSRRRWNADPSGNEARAVVPAQWLLASTFARLCGYTTEDRAWFEQACLTPVLVLDDLGAEHLGPVGRTMLDELVMRRHGAALRTVITSNLDGKAFVERIGGDRIYDRMRIASVFATCTGASQRSRK
jgi:DNA replication protein DnaC